MSKEKHTYVLDSRLALVGMYSHIRDGIERSEEVITREIRTKSSGDFFETDNNKFIFYNARDSVGTRGVRTHYLYVSKSLKDNEELKLNIYAMLSREHELPAEERLFWI